MLISRDDLCRLIPHSGEMCLLDGVVQWDESSIESVADSHRSHRNPLRYEGRLGIANGIEYGAQAMAVHGALLAQKEGDSIGEGYLVSTRDVVMNTRYLDDCTSSLVIRAQQLLRSGGNMMYEFQVGSDEGELLITGRATVASRGGDDV